MDFQLVQQVLKLKEESYEIPNEVDVSELSESLIARKLDEFSDRMDDDLHSIQDPVNFDTLRSFILHVDALSAPLQNKLFQVLGLAMGSLGKGTKEYLQQQQHLDELETFRGSWERLMFLVYWFVMVAERRATSKVLAGGGSAATTMDAPAKGKGKSKKGKKADENEDVWDWDAKKIIVLVWMNSALELDLNKIWTLMHERAPFISLFMDTANLLLETEANLKMSEVKSNTISLVATCVEKFGQMQSFQTSVVQNLRYSMHLADIMADVVLKVLQQSPSIGLLEGVFSEIGQSNFTADDKTAKEYARFLLKLFEQSPKNCLKSLSFLMRLIDSDSYTIRCSLIEGIGYILASFCADDPDSSKAQAVNLCEVLEERLLDVSSYCRSRALKTFVYLSEVEANEEQDGRKRNAIPLSRRPFVVDAVLERLYDKTGAVRKEAIRMLTKFVETHPFWLDGGSLDHVMFDRKRKELKEKLASAAVPEEDMIQSLKEALPQEAKDKMEREMKNPISPEHEAAVESAENEPVAPAENKLPRITLSTEEVEAIEKQLKYYSDATQFAKQMQKAVSVIVELLASKAKTDVVEAIHFFVESFKRAVPNSETGVKKMVHLVWSKDMGDNESKSIREYLVQAYSQLYLNVETTLVEKEQIRIIVRNLITMTFNSTLADLTSLEQLLSILMSRGLIMDGVIQHLWNVYGATKTEIPTEQRRGALIILGMLAKDNASLIKDKIPLLLKIGFGSFGREDLQLCRYSCIALQKLGYTKPKKGKVEAAVERYPLNHAVFGKLHEMLLMDTVAIEWFSFAEQAVNLIYMLADQPDLICSGVLRRLTSKIFGGRAVAESAEDGFQAADGLDAIEQSAEEAAVSCSQTVSPSMDVSSFDLARLFFLVGHVAIKEIALLEIQENELKARSLSTEGKGKKSAEKEELENVAGNCEDDIGDAIAFIRERELLYGPNSLLAVFKPLIAHVCLNNTVYQNVMLQRMALLSLCKLMCVSESFCQNNLQLLFTILEKSTDPNTRSNIIIGIGDLVVCFNNLIEQNILHLYKRLHDSDREVKKNALMVLTHLILNGMVKVKGQISEMAMCLEDPDERISDLTRLFFSELSTKDNAIYNNLPDIISGLSAKADVLDENQYKNIMKYLFSFIEKDKQTENIVEKLCQRFKNSETPRSWRDLAFCLSLLQFKSEKCIKKLADNIGNYGDRLHEETVFKYFLEIIQKARKFLKTESKQILDEFEETVTKLQETGKADSNMLANATSAAQKFSGWDKLPLSQQSAADFELVEKAATPMKPAAKKTVRAKAVARKPRRKAANSDDDDAEMVTENVNPNHASKRVVRTAAASRKRIVDSEDDD